MLSNHTSRVLLLVRGANVVILSRRMGIEVDK